MASQTSVSFTNFVKTAVLTVSSEASGYPKTNLQEPEHLGLPWRSTVTTQSWIVLDLGSAIPFDRLSLWGSVSGTGSPLSVQIQQNTTDSWGAPAYSSAVLPVTRDPDKRLYRLTVASGGNFTRRYTRVLIPAQAPVGGAAYFEVAGIHLGNFVVLPRGCSPGYRRARVTPRVSHTAALGKWMVSYETGDAFARQHWNRQAEKNPITPGIGDEWEAWLDIDRQLDAIPSGLFCMVVGNWGPSAVYMMRQENETDWQDEGLVITRDTWDLVEGVAG
jgi:hypothetical protein